jgi:hypothetical protein
MNANKDHKSDPRAQALEAVLRIWLVSHPTWYRAPDESGWGWRQRTAKEVARDLVPELAQMDVRLAGVLESPDGQLISAVVGWVLPAPQRTLFDLLTDAVILAAQAQNRGQKVEAGVLVGAAVALFTGLMLSAADATAATPGRNRSGSTRRRT